ncbi:hypothetical protein [Leptothrix ochracea]|uniref:hypothetical protein n=1 Tax=Leptothrix ochracea TaxID=735331 RepID=UPI0034E22FE9
MQADFLDAHQRHWQDAELLFGLQRLANADHLYGMAAECGLKRLMLAFGMPFNPQNDRPKRREDREHADGIWERLETYRHGHTKGPGYALPNFAPFSDWKADQRYAAQQNFDEARVNRHRAGAEHVCNLIRKAEREGLLT